MPNGPTPNDAALADIYNLAGNAAPPWFLPAAFTTHLTPIKISLAKTQNMLIHDSGASSPFNIVPFLDDSMPDTPPNNLPTLISVAAITSLNPSQLDAYCNGYVGVGHGLVGVARQDTIAQVIANWV